MPGPLPKDPKLRQRRNKTATRATFTDDGTARPKRTPELPRQMTWHPMTRQWWKHVWSSPMSDEYLWVDVDGLYRLAPLVNQFWMQGGTDPKLAESIARQGAMYGLTPMDRRRLQWEVARVEQVETRTRRTPPARQVDDPRALLGVVEGGKRAG